ncbi:fumarylacetoacetate hydrolase family protein [Nocardia asteroides]|uniref:fumarylacetoacetate hydrolase family protein n=1 Tax=Nocardia asteroides TaxID=1824 RepID=UPI002FCE1778
MQWRDQHLDGQLRVGRAGQFTAVDRAGDHAYRVRVPSRPGADLWVRPGDVLGSGTGGSGCLAELWGWRGERTPPPLRIGDTVTMTVEGIGTVNNTVIAGPPLRHVPAATSGC